MKCVLCGNTNNLSYNLKTSTTSYSQTALIECIVDDTIISNLQNSHCTTCNECFSLINELDNIKIRSKEIQDNFKKYIEQELERNNKGDEAAVYSDVPTSTSKRGRKRKCNLKSNEDESKNQNTGPFVCDICGQNYKHKNAFLVHMGMHNGINPFTCTYCAKSFTQKIALLRHIPMHTGEMPYQCDICGKRFIHRSSFNVHQLTHEGKKTHKCTLCGFALMSGSHLKRHMKTHTGEKNYSCTMCGKRFSERYNLVAHEKLHVCGNGRNTKGKYRCQICGNCYDRNSRLQYHLKNDHHKISLDVPNTNS